MLQLMPFSASMHVLGYLSTSPNWVGTLHEGGGDWNSCGGGGGGD